MNQRRIDPALYVAAADDFNAITTSAATRLTDAQSSLNQFARMAGDDPGGEQFAQSYDAMARSALQALSDIAVLSNTMDRAIMQSGWNHAAAEEAAGGDPAGTFTVRPARTPATVPAPPSAFGGTSGDPEAWEVVKDIVGMMWPNADTGKLNQAGSAWDQVESDVRAIATDILQADNALQGLNSLELTKLRSEVSDFASDVRGAAGDISEVGDLCRQYADDVEKAHNEVIDMLIQLAIEIAATVAIGAALSVFTFGASAVVAGGGITARIIMIAQRIVGILTRVSATAARLVARLAAITARIAPLANRFQRTARIVISVTSGTLAAGTSELAVKGGDANLLVAMGSGFVGGAVTDTVALAFGKYGQRVLVQALAGGAGGAASGASNGLLAGNGVDIRQVLISGAGGTALGGAMSIRGRRGGTADSADPGAGTVRVPDEGGPQIGGSDGPAMGDGAGIGTRPDYDGPQVTGGADGPGSGAGDGGLGTRPDYDGPQVTGGGDGPGGSAGDGGGIRIPDGEAPQSPTLDVTPPPADAPNVPDAPDAPNVPDAPDVPDAPNVPDAPDAPSVSDGPDAPDVPDAPDAPEAPGTVADGPSRADDISRQFDDLEADIDRQFDDLQADIDRQFDDLQADIDRQFDDLQADIDRQLDDLADVADGPDGLDRPDGPDGPDGPDSGTDAGDAAATPDRMSDDDFAQLTPAEQYDHAMGEIADGATTFANDADATQYGRDEWDGVADTLSPEVADATLDYTREFPGPSGITYHEINGALRAGPPYPPEVEPHITRIDEAMATHPLTEDVIVTRGTGISHWNVSAQDAPGTVFDEAAYMSTSLGGPADAFENKDVILHLRVPEGTPAMWVEEVSAFGAGERELLLGRGLQWEATRSVFIDGKWHVFGEVIR